MTTALFLPYYETNPYQDELARGLDSAGVDVVAGEHTDPLPLAQAFREHGVPDVVHLHWAHSLFDARYRPVMFLLGCRLFVELAVARLLGVDVVWTVHNRFHHERRTLGPERLFRALLCRVSDAILVHGEGARDAVVDAYRLPDHVASRVEVVPHGNYVDVYRNEVSRAEARERLGVDPDATVFLNVGNIRPYKNVPALVETFGELEDDSLRLLVVGQPPTDEGRRERLERRCARDDRVRTVFEYVPESELQLYLNAADAVVLPFEDVLTSGSVVLALSFGRPVVAPRLGCLPDTVGACDDLLYDPADPDGLERALERTREVDLDVLGARSLARAERLDWETIGRETASVYEEVRTSSVVPAGHAESAADQ